MSTTYTMIRKRTASKTPERAQLHADIGTLCAHLDVFDVALESIVVAGDGTATVTLSGPIRRDQREHLGLVDPEGGGR